MHTRILFGLALLWASPAAAERRDPLDQLALEVAVVAAHEGALDNREDTALVWQVVAHRANTTQGRIDFLRLHSPKALGREACTDQNCVWSVELLKNPDAHPASIDRKWWEKVREQSWRETLRYARGLVYGIDISQPCPGDPYTWGGAMDVEGAYKDRNLIPLGCVGVLNEGFTHAPRMVSVISARDASRIKQRRGSNGRPRRSTGLHTAPAAPPREEPGTS
jgi:hypothetical protein